MTGVKILCLFNSRFQIPDLLLEGLQAQGLGLWDIKLINYYEFLAVFVIIEATDV